jgi:hypothetical protein
MVFIKFLKRIYGCDFIFSGLLIMDMFYIFESIFFPLILYCLSSCNYFLNCGVLVPMDAIF